MRALKVNSELCGKSQVSAQTPIGECPRFEIAQQREILRTARKYENRGNEAKKSLKTKDLTIFDAANSAHFTRNLCANEPQKDQTTPGCEKTRSGLAIPMLCCDTDIKSASLPSQKPVRKAFLRRDHSSQPRQGRYRVAQGVSPGWEGPHLAFHTPLPLGGRGDGGEGGLSQPTACAVGYGLPPAPRAEFLDELLTENSGKPRDSHGRRPNLDSGSRAASTDWGAGILEAENLPRVNNVCGTLRNYREQLSSG